MADIGSFLSATRLGAPTWLWATGGVALVAGGYLYYRNKKTAAASTASTLSSSDAAGTTAGVTNPVGYPPQNNTTTTNYLTNPTTPPPTATAVPSIPSSLADLQMGNYVVKGVTAPNGVSDVYPGGVASMVYPGNENNTLDGEANDAFNSMEIFLANPGILTPWPVGTQIAYPLAPEVLLTPPAQTTSTTSVTSPSTTASGS
jgi:hypothetical protein